MDCIQDSIRSTEETGVVGGMKDGKRDMKWGNNGQTTQN
jgi:hypothetical protein